MNTHIMKATDLTSKLTNISKETGDVTNQLTAMTKKTGEVMIALRELS